MNSNDIFHNYLRDIAVLFKEEAVAAKQEREKYRGSPDEGYYIGQLIAWHTVVSMLQQQAIGLGLPLAELQLDDILPERDLL